MQLKKAGFSDEDATALLERAFGWRTQTFWRGLKKEEVPVAESVAATLDFLRDLGAPLRSHPSLHCAPPTLRACIVLC